MKSRFLVPVLVAFACLLAVAAQAREKAIPKDAGKFTDYMVVRFTEAMPDAKVSDSVPLRVEVVIASGPHTVYLDNIWSLCERDRRQCRKNIDDFIVNMSGTMKEASAEVKAADIRVVVRTADYIAQARTAASPPPFCRWPQSMAPERPVPRLSIKRMSRRFLSGVNRRT